MAASSRVATDDSLRQTENQIANVERALQNIQTQQKERMKAKTKQMNKEVRKRKVKMA